MKKLLVSLLFVMMLVAPISAANYGQAPGYEVPESKNPEETVVVEENGETIVEVGNKATEVPTEVVVEQLAENESVTIEVKKEAASLSEDLMSTLAGTDKSLVVKTGGYVVEVKGSDITSPKALDLAMSVMADDRAIKVTPNQKGEFFATVYVTLPKHAVPAGVTPENAVVVYVADDGTRSDAGKPTFNEDGSVTIAISHASYYEIVSQEKAQLSGNTSPVDPVDPIDPDVPDTGDNSVLYFGLGIMVLAGLGIVVLNKKANA